MKKLFILCSEDSGTCDDIEYLISKEKEVDITFKKAPFSEEIPNVYDGYHININALEIQVIKKLREGNPKSLIYGTGQRYNRKENKKVEIIDNYSFTAWEGIKKLIKDVSKT